MIWNNLISYLHCHFVHTKLKVSTRLGTEIFYSNKLINMDLELMFFENSKYILIEFLLEILPFGIIKS